MTTDLRFELTADQASHTVTVIREFNGRRQLVWDCHTRSELLDQWFAPKPLTTQTRHMDFRAGGYWHYAMITPEHERHWYRLDYRTIDPIDGYTAQDSFCDEAGTINPDLPGSHWDVAFADQGKRTLVTTMVRFASSDALQAAIGMGLKDGLASTLERLDELLLALQAA